jgi:flagellar motor switch/type III secretory pathway protein FliN
MNVIEDQPAATTTATAADPLRTLSWMPLTLSLETSLSHFTVQDLMRLGLGTVVQGVIAATEQIPVRANGKLIAWAKLDVVGNRLAARITELV